MAGKKVKAYLCELEKEGIALGLERIEKFLALIGNPHFKFKTVHIAGTNGKGSTSAMLASVLRKAGFKTGLYTSPHLVSFNERIQINGKQITDKELDSLVSMLCGLKEKFGINLTYFEFITALTFVYFAEKHVDFAVIEVGLGGRLDATNVVKPEATAITNISLEHGKILGWSIGRIAREKAGIVKNGVPLFTTERSSKILQIFAEKCGQNIPFKIVKEKYSGKVPFEGEHQNWNAALAASLATQLGIDENAIKEGIACTKWPARFELVQENPPIFVDVAHNPAGAESLARVMKAKFGQKKPVLVFGVASDKDVEEMAKHLAPLSAKIIVTSSKKRGMPAKKVADAVKKFNSNVSVAVPVQDAVKKAIAEAFPIVVCGSHFVVGEALRAMK